MTLLAKFHIAAASFTPILLSPSPSIVDRTRQLQRLRGGEYDQIVAAVQPRDWPVLAQLGRELLQLIPKITPRILFHAERVLPWQVSLQPCIRDVWHDHVLFTGDAVSGLIDFGAMRVENVAADVARLVGSLVSDDREQRLVALRAYQQLRPLSPQERELIEIFDQTTTVLGGVNWLRWIYIEHREFADRRKVEQRFNFLLRRLQQLAAYAV
jgi:homoserine kinase type II